MGLNTNKNHTKGSGYKRVGTITLGNVDRGRFLVLLAVCYLKN